MPFPSAKTFAQVFSTATQPQAAQASRLEPGPSIQLNPPSHVVYGARVVRRDTAVLTCILRPTTLDDAALLAETIRTAFAEYQDLLEPPSLALSETAESVMRVLRHGGAFVAEWRGQVMGCVRYGCRGDHLYLSRLSVRPEFRGRGLARCMTQVVEQQALALGLNCVRLSVRTALLTNRSMYLRFGYRHFGFGVAAGCPGNASEMLEKHLHAACHRVAR